MRGANVLSFLLAMALSLGCSKSKAPDEERDTVSGGTSNTVGDETGGASGGSAGGGGTEVTKAAGDPQVDCAAVKKLGVRIVGRFEGCEQGPVRMAWSGTGFIARFRGTGLRFVQKGSSLQYTVVIDGQLQPDLETQSGEATYVAASGLSAGEHQLEVYRRGEAHFGVTELFSVEVDDGELLEPPPAPERRIEIFGDSISCGYGNEGTSTDCSFSADTENHYLTYGALLARHFGADLSTVAWSGKGVVINYGGDTSITLPELAERALPEDASSLWRYDVVSPPQAVIINLGTNDYSTDNDPSDAEFVSKYVGLLEQIRGHYPDAHILCTVGPLLSGSDLATARKNIAAAVGQLASAGDERVEAFELAPENPDPGCDWHPSLSTHQRMASELQSHLAQVLGW